ncbi:MAG: aminoacetone oxidase family FAD-binding enzyme [Lachnospiraceae bacterium]|nr:aminoacetone oxidase family FAD-binding enzyme [Lachnospiraceae bacterium]
MSKEIAIIGGGASGLVAAYYACKNPENHVTVYEKNEIAGKKLRQTGNGRLNFSNEDLSLVHYEHYSDNPDPGFLHSMVLEDDVKCIDAILSQNGLNEYVSFLEELGVPSFEKNGYYYPYSERAGEVSEILYKTLAKRGVDFMFSSTIKDVSVDEGGRFSIQDKKYDSVILACGGKAMPNSGSDGGGFKIARFFEHTVTYTYPVLVPLCVSDGQILKELAGVRVKGEVAGYVDDVLLKKDYGEIQFTEKYISGIPVFQLSRHLTKAIEELKNVKIICDFFPELLNDDMDKFIERRKEVKYDASFEELFEGILPEKLYRFLLDRFIKETKEHSLEISQEKAFLIYLKSFPIEISGHAGFENAQCTRGGIVLSELSDNLESKLVPNLYMIGEMLNVDGDCGGYNLQWAYSSGRIAGENA